MKKHRPVLTWIRRAALALCALAFLLSFQGIFTAWKGDQNNDEPVEFNSFNGVVSYLCVYIQNGPKNESDWHAEYMPVENRDAMEYRYGSFHWETLGFHYVSRPAATSSTGAVYLMRNIAIPYWPFLLALAVPELWLWLKRKHLPTSSSSPSSPDSSLITHDLPCVQCGYNLRMLPTTAACPECGAIVSNTLNLNKEMAKSRPAWLRRLTIGNVLLLLSRAFLVAAFIATNVGFFSIDNGIQQIPFCLIAMTVIYVVAIFFLTGNEHPYLRSPHRSKAIALRVLSVFIFFCTAGGMAYQYYYVRFFWDDWQPLAILLLTCAAVMYGICVIVEYRFLAILAGRLLDRFMTEHCTIAGIGAGITSLSIPWIVWVLNRNGIPDDSTTFYCLCGAFVALSLFLLWTGFMNVYCAVRFARLARQAQERWESREETAV